MFQDVKRRPPVPGERAYIRYSNQPETPRRTGQSYTTMNTTIQTIAVIMAIISVAMTIGMFYMMSNVNKMRKRICGVPLFKSDFDYWEEILDDKSDESLMLISKGLAGYVVGKNNPKIPVNEECIQIARLILEKRNAATQK